MQSTVAFAAAEKPDKSERPPDGVRTSSPRVTKIARDRGRAYVASTTSRILRKLTQGRQPGWRRALAGPSVRVTPSSSNAKRRAATS